MRFKLLMNSERFELFFCCSQDLRVSQNREGHIFYIQLLYVVLKMLDLMKKLLKSKLPCNHLDLDLTLDQKMMVNNYLMNLNHHRSPVCCEENCKKELGNFCGSCLVWNPFGHIY